MSDQRLRTGELAERAGVNVQTLRYYERHGLLAARPADPPGSGSTPTMRSGCCAPSRPPSAWGFTLAEIEELLDLSAHRRAPTSCSSRPRPRWPRSTPRSTSSPGMRERLGAVLAAECDSLTNCSCGLGCPLPELDITEPNGGNGDHD